MMEIKLNNDKKSGVFQAFEDGIIIGEMLYEWTDEHQMTITHTEVREGFEGRGIAKQLVLAGVDYARDHSIKIVPICPYAKKMFDKHEDIRDVL